MIKTIVRFIQRISKRPLVALSWTIFTAAIIYVTNFYIDNPELLERLEEDTVRLRNLEKEHAKIEKLYLDWRYILAYDSNVVSPETFDKKLPITENRLLPLLNNLEALKVKINKISVQANSMHFEVEKYENIRSAIANDLQYMSAHHERLMAFVGAIMYDFEKAKEMKPLMEFTSEIRRRFDEMDARYATLDEMLDLAREEHNVMVRSYNSRNKVYNTKSWVNIIAYTYMSSFIGSWLGYLAYRRRWKRQRAARVTKRMRQAEKDSAAEEAINFN